ncbi:tetratricopeptide repeat protein [Paractinoplanes durhamensis]|uniref:tetratricopeptide repeat protein n=1 Tax=Paractinoplanes durhamensis TaxID=113563 RepID=UPI0031D25C60
MSTGRAVDQAFVRAVVAACHRYAKFPGEPDLDPWLRDLRRMLRDEARETGRQQWVGGRPPSLAGAHQHRRVATDLDDAFRPGHLFVLNGLGGVGKTQLAAELARRSWADYQVEIVVWVTATSREKIIAGYADAAALLGIEETDAPAAADLFLAALSEPDGLRWLIVLDDLQDPADLSGLWPPAGNGNAVVTTRSREAALAGHHRTILPVGPFEPAESHRYLSEKLGPGLHDPHAVDRLADELGHLPLALAQAAAYLMDRHLTCDEYLRRFRARRLDELQTRLRPDDYAATLTSTFALSIERANERDPSGAALPLLELAAVLSPNGIPAGMFTAAPVQKMLTDRRGRATTADDSWDGLANLEVLSLGRLDDERRAVVVHQLLQRSVRESGPADRIAGAAVCAADALLEIWPDVEGDLGLVDLLRANVEALIEHAGGALWDGKLHQLLLLAGNSLPRQGLLSAAVRYWERLLPIAIERLGPEHADSLTIRNNLCWAVGRAGDAVAALAGLRDLLRTREQLLGADHPNTLATRHAVAHWQDETGDHDEAVAGLRRLIDDYERVLGGDHRDTLNTRIALVETLGPDNPVAAVAELRLLLDGLGRVLGPDDPEVLEVGIELCAGLEAAGEGAEALSEMERLLGDYRRVLGATHADTLTVRYLIIGMKGRRGRSAEAVPAARELLDEVIGLIAQGRTELEALRAAIVSWLGQI